MTKRDRLGRILIPVLMAGLAGCTTASLQDAAPTVADARGVTTFPPAPGTAPGEVAATPVAPLPPPRDAVTGQEALAIAAERAEGPQNTNQFPNLNVAPERNEARISEEKEAEDIAALAQRREALAVGAAQPNTAAAAEAERLRALGATHADEALRQIERP
jgi:hypothetical protein